MPDPYDPVGWAGVGPMMLLPCGFFFAHSLVYYIFVLLFPVPKGYLNQFIYMAKTVPLLKPLSKLP